MDCSLNAGRFRARPVMRGGNNPQDAAQSPVISQGSKLSNQKEGESMRKKLVMKLKAHRQYISVLAVLFGWTMFIAGNVAGLPILIKLLLLSVARALP